jgi:hypothetical protein
VEVEHSSEAVNGGHAFCDQSRMAIRPHAALLFQFRLPQATLAAAITNAPQLDRQQLHNQYQVLSDFSIKASLHNEPPVSMRAMDARKGSGLRLVPPL